MASTGPPAPVVAPAPPASNLFAYLSRRLSAATRTDGPADSGIKMPDLTTGPMSGRETANCGNMARPSQAEYMDDIEIWFDKGVTDGLPVVPPTRERVERMLAGTARDRSELVGEVAPNYGRATVEKVAVNAVMAGCRPDYLPVVLAAVEAACDSAFNLHGMSTSTHFSAPLIVVNGPIRERIGLNCAFGVFGPGYRANATIGRALRLVMINVGGAKPGETSMSTFGHPGRYTYCIGEYEEASPWTPYHVERGFQADESAVTVFAGEAPHGISDHSSRTARSLAGSLGWSMRGLWNAKHFPLYSHTMLAVGPEPAPEELVPKFPSVEEIHVIVAGGTAGRFSMAIAGWLGTKNGSAPITVPVRNIP